MNRHIVLIMSVIIAISAAVTAFAQRGGREIGGREIAAISCGASPAMPESRAYNQIMKAIDATSASLRKNLNGTGAAGVDDVILNERGGLIRMAADRLAKPPSEQQKQTCGAAAAEDAAKLQGLFKQIEDFWASFNTQDAVDFAKTAQSGAATVLDKVKSKDFDAAQVAFGTMRETCRDCHFAHRQTTGNGFVIKP